MAERAAVLIGQAEALRESIGFEPDEYALAFREEVGEAARRELGEDRFNAATHRGAQLSVDDAVRHALGSLD